MAEGGVPLVCPACGRNGRMVFRARPLLFALRLTEARMAGASGGVQQRMGAAEWAMLVAMSVLWGGSFFFNGVAVRELPSFTIVVARVGIATFALWAALA